MLEATREAIGFARERRRKDLDRDRMLLLSLVKALEMIGEAASKVTVETRDSCPEIPWSEIVAMRNRLIHVYFDINAEIVWQTVIDDLPALERKLQALLDRASAQ
jgi:uncharacterized protein with HEPN domain